LKASNKYNFAIVESNSSFLFNHELTQLLGIENIENIENIIRIEVKDDGIGIPAKDKPRIFERFFRVDKASAIYAEGSGLGLSIVKNAVELLSGTYGFESEENVGSLFWVELKKGNL